MSSSIQSMLLSILISNNRKQKEYNEKMKRDAFKKWISSTHKLKLIHQELSLRSRLIAILKTSTRGNRTALEKAEIGKYISEYLPCVPSTISFSEMDQLCNEVDVIPSLGRSILFLQGDYGNVYYMIVRGKVGLYLEPNKDREVAVNREFGHLRLKQYLDSDEDLNRLGSNIVNLKNGAGFGEYAILSSANKIRTCSAVALDEDSMLLLVHADTYNATLRHHHYREKQLHVSIALLQEMSFFQTMNISTLTALAYTMKGHTYSKNSIVVHSGSPLNDLHIILSGDVKVYTQTCNKGIKDMKEFLENKRRIPQIALSIMGRGRIIGESEVFKGVNNFEYTYEVVSSNTEIFAMPTTVFKEAMSNGLFKHSALYKSLEASHKRNDHVLNDRAIRAVDVIKSLMIENKKDLTSRNVLERALPTLINPPMFSTGGKSKQITPRKPTATQAPTPPNNGVPTRIKKSPRTGITGL